MLNAVLADEGRQSVSALARAVEVPIATAHRQVRTLVAEGLLAPIGGGRHAVGPGLLNLLSRFDRRQIVANVAAPVLYQLAARLGCVVQLGTLENDMVTYRIKTGQGAGDLFTRVGMQLEAYCSGIGKTLLANLPRNELDAYLAGGPFVALTAKTITDPGALRRELEAVRDRGFGTDRGEVAEGLSCVAVPLRDGDGRVIAAISASQSSQARIAEAPEVLDALREAAAEIQRRAFE